MTEPCPTALLLSGDDDLTAQVASALRRVGDRFETLRRVGTLALARAVLGHTDVGMILADPRAEDTSTAELAAWLRGRDEPGLLVVPSGDVAALEGAQDVAHEIVVPGAPDEVLAGAVRRLLEEEERQAADDWLQVVRHEMATPLTAIEGFIELLRTHGDELPAPRRRASLDAAHRNVGRLRRLAADLNAAAKVAGPAIRTSTQVVPLRSTLLRAIQDLGPGGEGVDAHVESDVQIRVDTDALQAIVSNLVSNAFKYGAPPVELRAGVVGDHVEIAVLDHGPGIPDSFVPRLFERYARAEEVRHDAPGTGLGLWLCAQLASAMDGELRYEPDGARTRFVLAVAGERSERPEDHEDVELIDIAAVEGAGPRSTSSLARRAVISGLEVVREGLEAHTTVGLIVGDRRSQGRAVGASSATSSLRAVARATLDAIDPLVAEDVSFDVEHVRVDGQGDDEYVMVTVTAVSERGFERVAGVAFARDDLPRAALRATLDALNRRIEPLLV